MKKVTIGLLTYNSMLWLPTCLEALVNQDYPNIEILILDDLSSDNSYEWCVDFSKCVKNIRVIQSPQNLGTFGAIRVLLDNVSSEYFLWVAPDDNWSKNYISKCVESLDSTKNVAAMGTVKNIWDVEDIKPYNYDYNDLDSKPKSWNLIKSILNGKDFNNQSISYNQFIHGLLTFDAANIILRADTDIWIHEQLLICVLVCIGGISFAKDCYHVNLHSVVPLAVRNPSFAAIKFSKIKYFIGLLKFIKLSFRLNNVSMKDKIRLFVSVLMVLKNACNYHFQKLKCFIYLRTNKFFIVGKKHEI